MGYGAWDRYATLGTPALNHNTPLCRPDLVEGDVGAACGRHVNASANPKGAGRGAPQKYMPTVPYPEGAMGSRGMGQACAAGGPVLNRQQAECADTRDHQATGLLSLHGFGFPLQSGHVP